MKNVTPCNLFFAEAEEPSGVVIENIAHLVSTQEGASSTIAMAGSIIPGQFIWSEPKRWGRPVPTGCHSTR